MKRRDFLKVGSAGVAGSAFALSGLTAFTPKTAQAATHDINLVAEGTYKTLVDGASVFVWQFNDTNGTGPGALASGLMVTEGDTVNVTVTNNVDRAIRFSIDGVTMSTTSKVNSGSSRTYSFTAPGPRS